MKTFKLGVVGTSWITDTFLSAIKHFDNITFTTIYSRTKEKGEAFGEKYNNPKVVTSLEDLKNEVDIVYIASPNSMHYEQAKYFLENGVHCVIEKPVSLKVFELEHLHKIATSNNVYFIEGIRTVYHPYINEIKNLLDSGDLGMVEYSKLSFMIPSSKFDSDMNFLDIPVFQKKYGGGSTYDIAVYPLHAALHLFGEPKKISAFTNGRKLNDVDSVTTIIFEYEDFHVNMTASKVVESYTKNEILCENGNIIFDGFTTIKDVIFAKGDKRTYLHNEMLEDDMQYYIKEFNEMICNDNREVFEKSYAISHRHMKVVEEVLKQIKY
ncbi:MAG: Gfo/Idh/MocA family protein [Lachnospirales bacterium]